jgi:hypothetical protein
VVEAYETKEFTGHKFSKHILNINEVSEEEDVTFEYMNALEKDKLFKVKKGFFKNTYYLTFKEADIKKGLSAMDEFSSSEVNDELINKMSFNMEVNLPTKPISSNATKYTSSGFINKTHYLSWDLSNFDKEDINLTFVIYNWSTILLCGGIALIIISITLLVLRRLFKTKHILYMRKEAKKKRK